MFGMGSEDRVYSQPAYSYLLSILEEEVAASTQCAARRTTFSYRIRAVATLYHYIEDDPAQRPQKQREWNYVNRVALERRIWSAEQRQVLDAMRSGTSVEGAARGQQMTTGSPVGVRPSSAGPRAATPL